MVSHAIIPPIMLPMPPMVNWARRAGARAQSARIRVRRMERMESEGFGGLLDVFWSQFQAVIVSGFGSFAKLGPNVT